MSILIHKHTHVNTHTYTYVHAHVADDVLGDLRLEELGQHLIRVQDGVALQEMVPTAITNDREETGSGSSSHQCILGSQGFCGGWSWLAPPPSPNRMPD